MRRRDLIAALGAAGLAGCVGDDGDGADETPTETTPEPTATDTPIPTSTASPTPRATDTPAPQTDPVAVVDAFFASFASQEPGQINELLHPDATVEPFSAAEATRLGDGPAPTPSAVQSTTDDRAVVGVRVPDGAAEPVAGLEAVELRRADGEWRIYAFERSARPPAASFEFEPGRGEVTVTLADGDSIPAERLAVRGSALEETGGWTSLGGEADESGTVTPGQSVVVSVAESPVSVEVVWAAGDTSATLATSTLDVEPAFTLPQDAAEWLSDANGYETVTDRTDTDQVQVAVGAGSGRAFEPAALRVTTGTTVTWEWTGEGGSHNVVDDDGAFESDLVAEAGHTFEHTFAEPGTTLYYCFPHRPSGMKGVVVVE